MVLIMTIKIVGAAAAGLLIALAINHATTTEPEPPHVEVKGATIEAAELIDADYPGPGLIALRQWTPRRDLRLICENYDEMLPMRPADLWVTATVPDTGRVLIVASAQSANSEPDLGDYWGVMIGDDVVASGLVGVGDEPKRAVARFVVEGLTPGEEVRFDIAHRSDEGGTANIYLGPTYGPAVIEVYSA